MFFFFPFALQPVSLNPVHKAPLPILPAPSGRRPAEYTAPAAFEDAFAQAGDLSADLIRHALISMMSSLTALGNQANLLFSQILAALVFDRMARQTAAFFGMRQPAFGPFLPPLMGAAGLWPALYQSMAWYSPAAIRGWPVNPWANPWIASTEAFTAWAKIWESAMAQRPAVPSASGEKPPFTATFSMPGCSWSVTLG